MFVLPNIYTYSHSPNLSSKFKIKLLIWIVASLLQRLLYTSLPSSSTTSFMRIWHYFSWQNGFPCLVKEGRFSNCIMNWTLTQNWIGENPIQSNSWLDIFYSLKNCQEKNSNELSVILFGKKWWKINRNNFFNQFFPMQFLKAFNFFYPHMYLGSVTKRKRHQNSH